MSLEENKIIISDLFKVLNTQNLALPDDLVASDYIDHTLHARVALLRCFFKKIKIRNSVRAIGKINSSLERH